MEAAKPGLKKQAQEWAGLEQNPEADLFVFVGRWSQQKGVDLIADVFPSILEANPQVQLICVGPMIDLYGKFAALKLGRMMEVYPKRVYSKPEFTALPPYIFSGADFALMPSRDEPFGLVAVEFGRKGALCVGARVGGLGQMPGWWFTIESTTTKHVMQQFKTAISGALASKSDVRAIMRARAAKQRFPVAQWVEDLEKLQSEAIKISERQLLKAPSRPATPRHGVAPSRRASLERSRPSSPVGRTPTHSRKGSGASSHVREKPLPNDGLGSRVGPGYRKKRKRLSKLSISYPVQDSEYEGSSDEDDGRSIKDMSTPSRAPPVPPLPNMQHIDRTPKLPFLQPPMHSSPPIPFSPPFSPGTPSSPHWPLTSGFENHSSTSLFEPRSPLTAHSNTSLLSLQEVKGESTDYNLQHVSPFFTDSNKEFTAMFETKLSNLNGKSSEDQLCIEEYLVKSEKTWFGKLRAAEMGKSRPSSIIRGKSPQPSMFEDDQGTANLREESSMDEFLLGHDYVPPKGLKHFLRLRIGDWPLYSILLAFVSLIRLPKRASLNLV